MNPEQSRAARGILGWSVRDLAEKAGVGVNTVSRFENSGEAMHSTVTKMQAALETGGVSFIPAGDYQGNGGAGVRLNPVAQGARQ
ncbi:MAG: helix-turn-helix transcriptional regulator [Alphaproteobacteria bacterium]|nr:helix-turn-helix transcriptional regulator [Alphaproteobacteria bacterium]